ncbi:MAG: hypothetical protein AB1758_35585, partial [Candidatus Eremiobacterota bacterium]
MKTTHQGLDRVIELLARAVSEWGDGPGHAPGLSAAPTRFPPASPEYAEFLELWHALSHAPELELKLDGQPATLDLGPGGLELACSTAGELTLSPRKVSLPTSGWGEPPALLRLLRRDPPREAELSLEVPLFPFSPSEQELAVATALGRQSCVVVHGGPGSGKSHLAANLAAHYCAEGKSVLVLGPHPSTLAGVRTWLAVLQGDAPQDAELTYQHAVEQLRVLQRQLFEAIQDEYAPMGELSVEAAAQSVRELREVHGWAPGPVSTPDPPLTAEEFAELYATNEVSQEDLDALDEALPEAKKLPGERELARMIELEATLKTSLGEQALWKDTPAGPEALKALEQSASQVATSLFGAPDWWLDLAWALRCSEDIRRHWGNYAAEVEKSRRDVKRLEEMVLEADPQFPAGQSEEESLAVCQEILTFLSQGNSLNWVTMNTLKRRWKKFIEGCTVRGARPMTADAFRALQGRIHLGRLQQVDEARWKEEQVRMGWASVPAEPPLPDIRRALRWPLEKFSHFEKAAAAAGFRWEAVLQSDPTPGARLKNLRSILQMHLAGMLERRRLHLEARKLGTDIDRALQYLGDPARKHGGLWAALH